MNVSTPLADQLGHYLDLATAQVKATAENMANIDTPGYRTVGFDFDSEMQRALRGSAMPGAVAAGSGNASADRLAPSLSEVDGLLERPDGNNVSMEREGMQLAEAQLKFRTGLELAKREYTRILDAIHADAK
ncbi:MAG: flagellar basal body rod protein FlgB [Acidobacteriaceae bacterium]